MRKMLVLMLVLGMGSLATAVPTLTGPTSANPGDTITIWIQGTTGDASVPGGIQGGWSGMLGIDYSGSAYNPNPYMSFVSFSPSVTAAAGQFAANGSGFNIAYFTAGAGIPWSEATDVDAADWFAYQFTIGSQVASSTTIPVEIFKNWGGSVVATLPVHVVPEPITMALLGLGGLFLRRRK